MRASSFIRRGTIVAALAICCSAQGQGILTGKISSQVVRKRSDAPMTLEVSLDYRGQGLLEGCVELTFTQYGRVLAVVRSSDLALAAGAQTFRLMVPAVQPMPGDGMVAVRMRFIGGRGESDLGEFPLRVPDPTERGFLICVGEALEGGEPNPSVLALAQALRIERFNPDRTPATILSLATASAFVPVEDFPMHPLGYCQYDLVFLAEDVFPLLRERQLGALKSWVEAGGSVCVMPGRGLKDYQLRFLNDLAAQPGESSPRFELTLEGAVTFAGGRPATGIDLFRSELGRTAVVLRPVNVKEDLDTPLWRQMVAFLWKMRFSRLDSVVRGGVWNTDAPSDPHLPYNGPWASGPFSAGYNPAGEALVRALMPKSVRLVPLGLVALMLCGFLAVIGPLDYFLLGALKRRKYTWVLLPGACFGFTVAMAALSSHFMGRSDQRTAMLFCDVGKGGRILRTNRCELIFAGGQTTLATSLENALFSDLTHGPSFSGPGVNYARPAGADDSGRVLTYRGRVPVAYSVAQEVMQWRPQLNRSFSIEAGKSAEDFHWDAITPAMLGNRQRWGEVTASLTGGRPFNGCVVLCLGYEAIILYAAPDFVMGAGPGAAETMLYPPALVNQAPGAFPPNSGTFQLTENGAPIPWQGLPLESILLKFLSACPQYGLFSILSQISPTGGNNTDDFALLDPTDSNQWLLIVVRHEEDRIVVYRRLYWNR